MINHTPIYKKVHYFVQVGTKHVISMEIQIFNCKDQENWFGEKQLDIVLKNLRGELMGRIDRKYNDMELQIIEEDTLLMVYKFRPTAERDSIVLRTSVMEAFGLTSTLPTYGDGHYMHLILYPEKLIISVSLIDQCEELLNLTEANVEGIGSNYFHSAKKTTYSEKRKKDTLRKIQNTRNRLSFRKSFVNEFASHEKSENLTTEDKQDASAADPTENFIKEGKRLNDNDGISIKKVNSFVEKISMYDREKIKVIKSSNNNNQGNKISEKHSLLIGEETEVPQKIEDGMQIKNINEGFNDEIKNINEGFNDEIKNINEGFNDEISDDDFSSPICRKKRRRPQITYKSKMKDNKRKKPKMNTTPHKKPLDKHDKNETIIESLETKIDLNQSSQLEKITFDDDENTVKNDVTLVTISMDDLIRAKETEDISEPLEEIHTLIEDETIDLEDYGRVALDNIQSTHDLSPEQIRDLIRDMEDELQSIFKGKRKCERHDIFKKGGLDKGALNMQVSFGVFSEEQEESISNTLMEIFCPKKVKYFDYTMKVLLPEAMTMLYAKIAKITNDEAEKLIMERC